MNGLNQSQYNILAANNNNSSELSSVEQITDVPELMTTDKILTGLCIHCDHLGLCVWQHDNKISCEHFQ